MRPLSSRWRHALGVPLLLSALAGSTPTQAQGGDDGTVTWRFCLRGQDANSKTICFTGKGGAKEDTDVELTAEQQAAVKAELERRAEEARRKLEGK